MPTKRKTVKVADVAERVNAMLTLSDDDKTEAREALAVFLERVLMDTNNYRGYFYTDGAQGKDDPSRRRYYVN